MERVYARTRASEPGRLLQERDDLRSRLGVMPDEHVTAAGRTDEACVGQMLGGIARPRECAVQIVGGTYGECRCGDLLKLLA
jgi:hypothetical protein